MEGSGSVSTPRHAEPRTYKTQSSACKLERLLDGPQLLCGQPVAHMNPCQVLKGLVRILGHAVDPLFHLRLEFDTVKVLSALRPAAHDVYPRILSWRSIVGGAGPRVEFIRVGECFEDDGELLFVRCDVVENQKDA